MLTTYNKIVARISRRRSQCDHILDRQTSGQLNPWEFRFLSESLLSNAWIDWNDFVKTVLLKSCGGTTLRSGATVAPRIGDNSEARIRYEVAQLAQGRAPKPGKVTSGGIEPTWAHAARIVATVSGLGVANATALSGAFSAGGLVGPGRMQLVRNACAHKSIDNWKAVEMLRTYYVANRYLSPIDIIWAENANTKSFAIYEWLEHLEDIADLATK